MKKLLIFVLNILFIDQSFGWGAKGHAIIAEIAVSHMEPKIYLQVQQMLAGQPLEKVAVLADRLRQTPKYKFLEPYHYVNFDKDESYQISDIANQKDLIIAIAQYENVLRSEISNLKAKQQALKFLIHFVGDIHQPLHVGYTSDKGGTKIKIQWFNSQTNLHKLWDEHLIEYQNLKLKNYIKYINHITYNRKVKIQESSVIDWFQESRDAVPYLYDISTGKNAEYNYNFRHIKFLNSRLLAAGIRLGWLIENILKNQESINSIQHLEQYYKPQIIENIFDVNSTIDIRSLDNSIQHDVEANDAADAANANVANDTANVAYITFSEQCNSLF